MTRTRLLAMIAGVLLGAWPAGAAQPSSADQTRAAFLRLISHPAAPLDPELTKRTVEGVYVTESVSIASDSSERVPLLIMRKGDRPGRRASVIVLHGSNQSKERMLPQLRAYADLGLVAVAFDAPHHGERARPIPGLNDPYQSALLRAFRTGQGHPYLYDTAWDVTRVVDYVVSRDDLDPTRVGLVGFSKGGTEAYLAGAADPRIAVVVSLIGVQSFAWSLRRPNAWEARTWTLRGATEAAAADAGEPVNASFLHRFYDRIAPGLLDAYDGPAMLPLIAPRPLLVVNGDSDPRSPAGGVREAAAAAERAYAGANASEKFSFLLERDAAHEITPEGERAIAEWLTRWLSPAK